MSVVVVGIDPGGKSTAVVVLVDGVMTHHETFTRPKGGDLNEYVRETSRAIGLVIDESPAVYEAPWPVVAVEQVNRPNPHLGMINPQGAMDTSRMIGALVASVQCNAAGNVYMIEPNKHGSGPLASYPPELVGPREKGVYGSGKLRHERSAYDVALTAYLDPRFRQ